MSHIKKQQIIIRNNDDLTNWDEILYLFKDTTVNEETEI